MLLCTCADYNNTQEQSSGNGDHLTPIISSGLELVGKVLIALLLTPVIGYWGIIISEPIVWAVMVVPLIISIAGRLKKACK